MASIHVDVATLEWTSGVPFYGPTAVHEGKEIVQLKVLSDRRHEGVASPGSRDSCRHLAS